MGITVGEIRDKIFTPETLQEEGEREKAICDALMENLDARLEDGSCESILVNKTLSSFLGKLLGEFGYMPYLVCIAQLVGRMKRMLDEDEYILNTLCGADPSLKEKAVKLWEVWCDSHYVEPDSHYTKRKLVELTVTGIINEEERFEKCDKSWRKGLPFVPLKGRRPE